MESQPARRYHRKFTDDQLRAALQRGQPAADFAREVGCSQAAVSSRLRRLKEASATAALQPAESERFTSRTIDAIGQLVKSLERVNLLQDACDTWLRDAKEPERYNLDARADEIEVTYQVEVSTASGFRTEKRKKKLTEIMDCLDGADEDGARFCGWKHGEFKRADPRELILKTAQEARSTVSAAADFAKMLADVQLMQEWRETVLNAIGRAAPDVREAIEGEIRSSLGLRGLIERPAAEWDEVN